MQYLLLIMLTTASGNVDYKEPIVFYAKKACEDAQDIIKQMTPRNASVMITTACVKRGRE